MAEPTTGATRSTGDRPPPSPGPATVPGRHRATAAPPVTGSRPAQLWPLAALVVLGLVSARTLRGTPLPGDGQLATRAYGLLPGATDDGPLSPEGLAATHTAAYAAVTRAFSRHATLPGAERELLLVALLTAAFISWRAARRLGLTDVSCAVGLLALAAVALVVPLAAVAAPAALALPWMALAGYLATLRRSPAVALGLAAVALLPAVLLAPDVLLVALAGVGTVLASRARVIGSPARAAAVAVGTVLGLVAVRLVLPGWAPDVGGTARWGGSTGALVVLGVVLLLVALCSALLVPSHRPAAAGLLALTVLGVLPPSARVSALLVAVPLAALVLAGLVGSVPGLRGRRPGAAAAASSRPAVLVAASALVVLAGAALLTAPRDDFGAARDRALLSWAGTHLPAGTTLDADPTLAAELQHAGAGAGLLQAASAGRPVVEAPSLRVVAGEDGGAPVVARFADQDGRPLTVVDPAAMPPDATELDHRQRLGAALLANPRTQLPDDAAGLLRNGTVDPRLLMLLAGVVARNDVRVVDLPPVPGELGGSARRSALIAAPDMAPLQTWLAAQRTPLAPDDVRLTDSGLLVGFRYATDPDGVVAGAGG